MQICCLRQDSHIRHQHWLPGLFLLLLLNLYRHPNVGGVFRPEFLLRLLLPDLRQHPKQLQFKYPLISDPDMLVLKTVCYKYHIKIVTII